MTQETKTRKREGSSSLKEVNEVTAQDKGLSFTKVTKNKNSFYTSFKNKKKNILPIRALV